MNLDSFHAGIAAARRRYESFHQNRSSTPLDEVMEELGTTLEELQVASEEIHSQGDRLAILQEGGTSLTRRFRDHFELAPLPYLVTDRDGMIRDANLAAETLFGRTGAVLTKLPIVALASAPERFPLRARIAQLRAEPALQPTAWDLWLRHPIRGSFEATVSVSRARPGDPGDAEDLRWIVLPRPTVSRAGVDAVTDDEPARDLAARLERAEATIAELRQGGEGTDAAANEGRLLGALAHEIRNPMSALLGAAAIIRKTVLSEDQAEFMAMIERSARTVLEIVRSVLELAQIQSGAGETTATEFDLADVVEGTVHSACAGRDAEGIDVACRVDPALPRRVIGDPVRIGQVLENLLGNALKFTDRGEVTVTLSPATDADRPDLVVVAVSDTGPGIEPRRFAEIFEPFAPGGVARQRHGGTGLGLSITKELVERMGGSVHAESTLGRGSCFTVNLPLTPAATQPPPLSPISRRPRVLVGDMAEASRRSIAETLRSWNAEVVEVADGDAVMHHLDREDGDVRMLILDVRLAGRDDFALLERLRERQIIDRTLVVLPVRHQGGDVARLRELGVRGWILRPYRQTELHDRVIGILEAKSL